MTYWHLLSFAVVLVTGVVVYLRNRPDQQGEQRHSRHYNNNENYRDGASCKRQNNSIQFPTRKPPRIGDTCIVCLEVMIEENMHVTICNHGLHKECFATYKEQGIYKCPTCFKLMVYSVPGDPCVICMQELLPEDIDYLKCEHALHKECLIEMKSKLLNTCPTCRKDV